MLKYEMRVGTLGDDRYELDLFSVSCHDYYADSEKVEVRNIYTNEFKLYVGANVTAVSVIDKEDDFGGTYPVTDIDEVTVVQCDNVEKTFSFVADKYQDLSLNSINIEVEDTVLYLHFYFDAWHYFRSWENYGITFYVKYPSDGGNSDVITFNGCQVVTDTELKWRYDAGAEGIDDFMCAVFNNDKYYLVGYGGFGEDVDEKYVDMSTFGLYEVPDTACFTDEMYLKKYVEYGNKDCWRWELYDKQCNEGSLLGVSSYRLSYKFKNVNATTEYVMVPLVSVPVPMSLESGYNLYQEQNINTNFVGTQVEAAKNKSPEMEKFTYHPVFKVFDKIEEKMVYKPIHRIKFNLHFREREDKGWIVKKDGYWNGMNSVLYGDVLGDEGGPKKFFSYMNEMAGDPYGYVVDKGRQSDLLSYLGFSDSDVKYQKSRLKKSFIRLSFYDSMNRANQNLLCYSTVYLDSGMLFAKMMRGAGRVVEVGDKRVGLYVVSGQESDNRYVDLKVDREPCLDKEKYSIEDVEQFRLSSQIVVSGRESSSCSEGFYLYLWVDNDNGAIPSDIYMRVEFSHAGYGRVIPFTMPYDENGIYTFSSIDDVWRNGKPGTNNVIHYGWGVRKNELYSYIHFKYVYDSENRRHVYYLDDDTYGLDSYNDSTPDELELNLYEAKINFD